MFNFCIYVSVIRRTPSSSLAAPPVEEAPVSRVSDPVRAATPGIAAVGSDDSGTDLEDELTHVFPLPWMISPIPDSDGPLPVSPSWYPAPPLPASADPVSVTPLSPGSLRVVNALLSYAMCHLVVRLPWTASWQPMTFCSTHRQTYQCCRCRCCRSRAAVLSFSLFGGCSPGLGQLAGVPVSYDFL